MFMELIKVTIVKIATQDKSVLDLKKNTFFKDGIEYDVEELLAEKCGRVLENVCIREPEGTVKHTVTLEYTDGVTQQYMIHPDYSIAVDDVERKLKRTEI